MHSQHPTPPSQDAEARQHMQRTLREAFAPASRDADFRARVWQRIEAAKVAPQTWGLWLQKHWFGVGCAAALCIAAGLVGGSWLASEQENRLREQQLTHYLASIDAHLRLQAQEHGGGSHR